MSRKFCIAICAIILVSSSLGEVFAQGNNIVEATPGYATNCGEFRIITNSGAISALRRIQKRLTSIKGVLNVVITSKPAGMKIIFDLKTTSKNKILKEAEISPLIREVK